MFPQFFPCLHQQYDQINSRHPLTGLSLAPSHEECLGSKLMVVWVPSKSMIVIPGLNLGPDKLIQQLLRERPVLNWKNLWSPMTMQKLGDFRFRKFQLLIINLEKLCTLCFFFQKINAKKIIFYSIHSKQIMSNHQCLIHKNRLKIRFFEFFILMYKN